MSPGRISSLLAFITLILVALLALRFASVAPPAVHDFSEDEALRVPSAAFFVERAYPYKRIPLDEWKRAQAQAAALRATSSSAAAWIPSGPTNIGGRVTALAVHPTNSDIVYAAAAEGGVLRSDDAGLSWTPRFDDQLSISVGAVAIDPGDPNVVYAGTGEVNPGGGSVAYGGTGLYRSNDEGATWACIGLEDSGSIGRIRVDPTDPNRIFVAVMGHLWETGADRGVYRTTDGGAEWERVHFVDESTGCVDLIMRPDDPGVLYAAMWERLRQPEFYDYGGPGCAVYRSTNGGDDWTLVGGGLPVPGSNGGRIGLSLCAAQPDVMHAVYADRTGFFDGLFRSTDGGFAWSPTNDGALTNVFSSFGWWFGNVRTHPVDPDRIFVLGLTFYRSTNGGASYQDATGTMHVDHHGLAFGPGASPVIYNGNDGGVYRSTNGGTAWSKLFDLPITQAYRIALDANDENRRYVGAQDNGTNRTTTGSTDDWDPVFGGDGFQALVHPSDSGRIWAQFQYGSLWYTGDDGASWSPATSGVSGRRNWNSPIAQDPVDAGRRYFGTHRLYRSTGNTTWTAVSGDLTGGPHGGNSGQVDGTLTTISVSPLDNEVIWTGSDDGFVHVTIDGGTGWTDVSTGLPVRWITSVRADPFDSASAYVTVSGFRWAESMSHVYRTTNLGAIWDPIGGNLPEAPVNDLIPHPTQPGRLFVGTDLGAYETWNGGASWSPVASGLPSVVTTSLAYQPSTQRLFAGTYGRSLFETVVESVPPCPADLNGDGSVGFADLLTLLGVWGPAPGDPADFDGDGMVGLTDLIQLLASWGPCE